MSILHPAQTTPVPQRLLHQGIVLLAGVALMTLAARMQIPFWPVPMTLQTMAVLGFAILAGPRMATAIMAAYLMAGATGLPVFAGSPERGVGLLYMAGPTGGYLAGFLVASWLTGTLAEGRGLLGRCLALLAGVVAIYGLGVAWLAFFVPADKLLAIGVLPFLLGEATKIGLLIAASALFQRRG
ncbi:MAG: biotin transporter BioY [Roseomonas sp.]|nr:biotin transporter BioY [Roseomonas sp.]